MSSVCASGRGTSRDYNLTFHVGAVFIILFVSFSACVLPLLAVRYPKLRIPPTFLFLARHFGTGVLLATAFVHLLPTAFLSLTNPCLGEFWTTTYPSMAGAISLAAVFFVTIVEMVFSRGQHCCSRTGLDTSTVVAKTDPRQCLRTSQNEAAKKTSTAPERPHFNNYGIVGPRRTRSNSTSREIQRLANENAKLDQVEELPQKPSPKAALLVETSNDTEDLNTRKKAMLQCLLLELGILFHSVFIGIALSVATGRDFVVLLVAIAFHRTFPLSLFRYPARNKGWC